MHVVSEGGSVCTHSHVHIHVHTLSRNVRRGHTPLTAVLCRVLHAGCLELEMLCFIIKIVQIVTTISQAQYKDILIDDEYQHIVLSFFFFFVEACPPVQSCSTMALLN